MEEEVEEEHGEDDAWNAGRETGQIGERGKGEAVGEQTMNFPYCS
jgi:hypothetical protein